MKTTTLKNTGNSIKKKIIETALAISASMYSMSAYSDTSGAFKMAESATKHFKTQIVELAKTLFPFSLIILILAIVFTHDQKALQMELKVAAMICVGYVLLLIVSNDDFINTFTGLF